MVLAGCAGVDDYTRFCTVLTAYAESDFNSDATQGPTVGVFQQNPKWWPSALLGTAAQCEAFIADFQSKTGLHAGKPVADCWFTQRWSAPNPVVDPAGFLASPESVNYLRRVPAITGIIVERKLP